MCLLSTSEILQVGEGERWPCHLSAKWFQSRECLSLCRETWLLTHKSRYDLGSGEEGYGYACKRNVFSVIFCPTKLLL